MHTLTKEETARLLAEPNGPERLMEQAAAAFEGAWRLFAEDGSPAACAFLCRCARRRQFRDSLNERLAKDGRALLQDAFGAPVPKLRKNAARLSGALGVQADVPSLLEALEKEEQRFVRPSQILALGALGGAAAKSFLESYQPQPPLDAREAGHFREEQAALSTALRGFVTLSRHAFTGLPRPAEVELRAPAHMGETLARELEGLGVHAAAVHSASVRLHTGDLPGLFRARSFFELLLPISSDLPLQASVIAQRGGAFLNRFLPACHQGTGPFGYRIEVRGQGMERGSLNREIAAAMDGGVLVNAPGNYEVELRIEQRQRGISLYAKLFTLEDSRFAYRQEALPASMHPATAAAIIRYAAPFLSPGARVLDPCCGSGTFLLERGIYAPCANLTGVDISHAAVDIARRNALAAGSDAKFIANDCLRFTAHRPYDELVANLPFGNRVGSHADNGRLYGGLLDRLPQWLRPGGVAILYTMEFTLLKNLLRQRPGLRLLSQARTEAGGLTPTIFVVRVGEGDGRR